MTSVLLASLFLDNLTDSENKIPQLSDPGTLLCNLATVTSTTCSGDQVRGQLILLRLGEEQFEAKSKSKGTFLKRFDKVEVVT